MLTWIKRITIDESMNADDTVKCEQCVKAIVRISGGSSNSFSMRVESSLKRLKL